MIISLENETLGGVSGWQPGTTIQRRYLVRRWLGSGGMADAYLVHDQLLGRDVALKRMHAPHAHRFREEFMLLRGLVHPHVIRVYDFGYARVAQEVAPYYTAAFIDGPTLHAHASGRSWSDVERPLGDALEGLRALHASGIRHGDVKAENVIVDTAGRAVLIDLSCSQRLDAAEPVVAGTLDHIAPELGEGGRVDARADLYGVGALLMQLMACARGVPRGVEALAARLRQRDPAARPGDVDEVLEALGIAHGARPIPCREPIELLGRDALIARFDAACADLVADRPGTRAIVLGGQSGAGLSRALVELKWRAQQRVDVVVSHLGQPAPIGSLLQRAAGAPAPIDDPEALVQTVRDLARGEAMVLVIDDADRLSPGQRRLWLGLLRVLPADGRVLVLAVDRALPDGLPGVERIELGPLGSRDVARWLAGRWPERDMARVMDLTGGFPSAVAALTAELDAGASPRSLLSSLAVGLPAHRRQALERLPAAERAALANLAAWDGALDDEALGVPRAGLAALASAGWLRADADAWQLARRGEAVDILAALTCDERRVAHRFAAELARRRLAMLTHDAPEASEAGAQLLASLCAAGDIEQARAFIDARRSAIDAHPDPWSGPLASLARTTGDPPLALLAADVAESAGQHRAALSLLAMALRARPDPRSNDCAAIWLRAGAAHLRGGAAARALHYLRRLTARADALDPDIAARAWDITSRALIRQGAYQAAADAAAHGLAIQEGDRWRANLEDDLGIAESYLGDFDAARRHLDTAARRHRRAGMIRAQARTSSYLALADYRAGDTQSAVRGFARAMDLAEQCGAADLLSYAAQNLGSASHQLGDFGAALASYDKALVFAEVVGERHVEVMLRGNLTKLYADIGLDERALSAAERTAALAERVGLPTMSAVAESARGEVASRAGDIPAAREHFLRAKQIFSDEGATRELAEVEIHLAECATRADRPAAAGSHLDAAQSLADTLGAVDVNARLALARGRLLGATGESASAFAMLERALDDALRCGQRGLEAEIAAALSDAAEARGAPVLARRHRQRAEELWERTAATLPDAMVERFWQHPLRVAFRPRAKTAAAGPTRDFARERQLERLLDINKKLNTSLDADQVLAWTIDSALELTDAERGFVILRTSDGPTVAVARNIDPSASHSEDRAFSQNIAERVMHDDAPLVTVDAADDERFKSHRSVHAMRLKSVLAVPIRGRDGVMGVLYLDHRYKRGIFAPEERDLLVAFADQVAIALTNAHLVAQLERRGRELEVERDRIQKLMQGQARQIDRLHEEVLGQRQLLETRYDYGNIVGSSAAMRRLFGTLDRVVSASVPVLIEGESGTGKELIARAIHYNGPRKDRPLVAINCAALPETLLESELFGHTRGAFTGADRDREGLFVSARGGTVFLDELGEMPLAMQVKLLRVLQENEVRPVGGRRAIAIDCRVVAATNKHLEAEVAAGRFREDLFYRIGVVEITVPPLRERIEDIPELAARLLEAASADAGRPAPRLDPRAMQALLDHTWPGNVRELDNVLTKATLLADDVIAEEHLGLRPRARVPAPAAGDRAQYRREEAARMVQALRHARWNVTKAAQALHIPRATFYRRMDRYGIQRD